MASPQQKFDEALRPEKRPDPSSYMFVLHVRAKRTAAFVEWVSCGSVRGDGPLSVGVNDSQSLALGQKFRKTRLRLYWLLPSRNASRPRHSEMLQESGQAGPVSLQQIHRDPARHGRVCRCRCACRPGGAYCTRRPMSPCRSLPTRPAAPRSRCRSRTSPRSTD